MAEYSAEKSISPDLKAGSASADLRTDHPGWEGAPVPDSSCAFMPPETDVMTGGPGRNRFLLYQLLMCLKKAESIDIIVSFLMESGVKLLISELEQALDRGAKIRILTGNYLGITQPSALYLLKHRLGDRADLRFYSEKGRSFHAKSYIFHYSSSSDIFIGSSNLSRSALTSGIEWNYRFSSNTDAENYQAFYDTFLDLFENHSIVIDDDVLRSYSKNWHRPAVQKDLEWYDERWNQPQTGSVKKLFEPRGAQIEALCALENSRAEGAKRGLVCAATGIGKTILAAFDSLSFETVLFVAHREEILRQAAESFRAVRNSEDYGFFDGKEKCTDKPVIFASVATLGRAEYLREAYFTPDRFQYLIIDEIHHGISAQYQRIVRYFQPQFLLGLTATPDRMDGRDIYQICDYNVPYELSMKEAINKGMLVPFRYYGIFDDTDYSGLHLVRGRYDEKELNETYIGNVHRHELIYKNYCKHGSQRALGFCCSRAHAEEMAAEFVKRGVPAAAVYSSVQGKFSEDREIAIRKLEAGELRVIFSVDMFNEGVDIPDVDMVLFLRPTESPVVFWQQLGRGLRKARGKRYLTVLDFIGNYEKAGRVRFLLTGEHAAPGTGGEIHTGEEFPDDCLVDFDLKLIDLFREMDRKQKKVRDLILEEFLRVEAVLGHRPTRMELFAGMEDDVYELCMRNSKDNIFKNYLSFLQQQDRLTTQEKELCAGIGREFLHLLETTSMSKVYKMPVLRTFYNDGNVRMAVTEDELLLEWKAFFNTGTNWKDLKKNISRQEYLNISDRTHRSSILKNPVHFLLESGRGLFVEKEGYALALSDDLRDIVGRPAFAEQMGDIIEYRTMDYYRRRYREKDR